MSSSQSSREPAEPPSRDDPRPASRHSGGEEEEDAGGGRADPAGHAAPAAASRGGHGDANFITLEEFAALTQRLQEAEQQLQAQR